MTALGRSLTRSTGVGALWRNRSTLITLVQRDLAVKYQRSVLGYFWSLIEPLGMAAIYYLVFGVLYSSRDLVEGGSYPVFVVSGVFAWQWASSAMSESTKSLTSQAQLITTMRVPREIFPVAKVIARFAEFAAGLPIILLFAVFTSDDWISPTLLVLPVAVLLQTMLLVGLAFLLGSVNVLMRDIERFMRLVMRILFYAAPIIYPLSKVMEHDGLPDWAKTVYMANPYVGIIQLHHAVWNPNELPGWPLFGYTAAVCVIVLFLGWAVFRRLEPKVLKEL